MNPVSGVLDIVYEKVAVHEALAAIASQGARAGQYTWIVVVRAATRFG